MSWVPYALGALGGASFMGAVGIVVAIRWELRASGQLATLQGRLLDAEFDLACERQWRKHDADHWREIRDSGEARLARVRAELDNAQLELGKIRATRSRVGKKGRAAQIAALKERRESVHAQLKAGK